MADKEIGALTDGGAAEAGDLVHAVRGANSRKVALGSAAGKAATEFATSTQGSKADSAVQPGSLAPVATSGDYGDLDNLPTLGDAAAKNTGTTAGTVAAGDDSRITGAAQKASNLSDLADAAAARTNLALATVASTGAYGDLSGVPSTVSQAEAEAGTATTVRSWTAQRVAQAIAALAGGGGDAASPVYNAVNSYLFAVTSDTSGINANATVAGSSLKPSNAAAIEQNSSRSGTWRAMGYARSGSDTSQQTTLWCRVS